MKRPLALALLAVLASSQYAALSCPMDLPVVGSRAEADPVAGHHGTDHLEEDGQHASEGHESHDAQESCLILMSCGSLAISDLDTATEIVRLETPGEISFTVASLVSFSADIESPPPRHG